MRWPGGGNEVKVKGYRQGVQICGGRTQQNHCFLSFSWRGFAEFTGGKEIYKEMFEPCAQVTVTHPENI